MLVGTLLVLTSLSIFLNGIVVSMAGFNVPTTILHSSHYQDAISWVYIHMISIGILLILLGFAVKDVVLQKWVSLVLFVILLIYTILDFKTSDSALGNGLYKGDASLIPAIMSLLLCLIFLQVSIRLFTYSRGLPK